MPFEPDKTKTERKYHPSLSQSCKTLLNEVKYLFGTKNADETIILMYNFIRSHLSQARDDLQLQDLTGKEVKVYGE